ncbi:MAG: helix-turn-helix transcriptional regulator [Janthinobacterium lividum]
MVTRIRQLLEHKHLTPTQFADLIGVGRPVVSHILSERNKPSLEVAQRIGSAFPDISLAWLMFGTGEMLAAETASLPAAPNPAPLLVHEPAAALLVSEPPFASVPQTEVMPTAPEPVAPAPSPAATVFSAAPVPLLETLPRPFSASQPAAAALLGPEPVLAAAPAALPGLTPPPEAISDAAPVVPRPFRAARFVPAASAAPAPAWEATVPLPPVASLAPVVVPAPAAAALPAGANSEAAMLPFLAESGKAIRRIVIFYKDGSFADYRPE